MANQTYTVDEVTFFPGYSNTFEDGRVVAVFPFTQEGSDKVHYRISFHNPKNEDSWVDFGLSPEAADALQQMLEILLDQHY